MFLQINSKTKKIIKPLFKSYLKFFPNKNINIKDKNFSYNNKANSYFFFNRKTNKKKKQLINFNIISKQIFLEIGQKTFQGLHPEVKKLYPTACSWVPYFENQSHLVFTNFLSTHYGLNNPQIVLLRYEAFNQNKLIEKYKTLIVLPEQTIWFNENFVSEDETSIFSKGKLFLYLFDPLFRPSNSQIRYHVIFEKNSFPTCGVHSWVSHNDELIIKHKEFLSRRFMCNGETKKNYFMVPPFGNIVKCLSSKNDLKIIENENKSLLKLPYELKPEISTQRGGFFVKLDNENIISRIWHDNGTGQNYPVTKNNSKSILKESDFCFPLDGYYFNLIIPNPVGKNLVIEKKLKVSAHDVNSEKLFLEKKINESDIIKPNGNLFAFEINLKNFFKELNSSLPDEFKKKNKFVRIKMQFETSNFNESEAKDEFTSYLYMFDKNDNICDQIHNEWSKSSIFGGKKFGSYRTNKFAPFKIQQSCDSFIILKNRFNINQNEEKLKIHKLRITINYTNKNDGEKKYYNKTKYLNFEVKNKFLVLNVRDIFFKNDKDTDVITGGIHIFCSTINSWGYWMIKSKDINGREFLACDHLTGG